MGIVNWFKKLLGLTEPESASTPAPSGTSTSPIQKKPEEPLEMGPLVSVPDDNKVKPPLPKQSTETRSQQIHRWTKAAVKLISSFEGSTPWANITGNFDGYYLTCGALGWTFRHGEQQKLVKRFVALHGEAELYKLMPRMGKTYWSLCKGTPENAYNTISQWSDATKKSRVVEPYKSELQRFWQDPRMVEIQTETIETNMVPWALKNMPFSNFKSFLFMFDTKVLNGSLETATKNAAINARKNYKNVVIGVTNEMRKYYTNPKVYNDDDGKANAILWGSVKLDENNQILLMMGWLRALSSRSEFVITVINRRGTIVMGTGYVNGSLIKPYDITGIDPNEALLQA